MSLLNRLEAALERIAEGGAERVFGGRLDLVAVGQELYNAAVEGRRMEPAGPLAPNAYRVHLALSDYGHFSHEVEALQSRYAWSLWSRLRETGYALLAPPTVLITPLEKVGAGSFEVETSFVPVSPLFTLSNPAGGGTVYRLGVPATIGRGTECDLQLSGALVSRRHARIVWSGSGYRVADLRSKNGTRLNGIPVSEAPLGPGDVLTIGDVSLRFAPEIAPLPASVGNGRRPGSGNPDAARGDVE